jgi:superfamily I DNA/RNA helicase
MTATVDLLTIRRGTVTAPAGCGKTHLIAETLVRHDAPKPILILTHTNSGVVALRARLDRFGVPSRSYRVATLDGWAMKLISMFPTRTAVAPEHLKLDSARPNYPNIRRAAAGLVRAGHIDDVIAATYSRLFVDEYQDCSIHQHAIAYFVSRTLPTCVLGDPMQAIFGFAGDLASWEEHVCKHFPIAECGN